MVGKHNVDWASSDLVTVPLADRDNADEGSKTVPLYTVQAIADIKPGDELLANYGYLFENDWSSTQ